MVGMTDDNPGPDPGPDAGAAPRKLLTRSRRQKAIGGVCGGLGRYFGIDPVIFRVVLALLALTGGVGLISYGIGWLLIPADGEEETELRRLLSGRIEGTSMTAVFCALVGSGLFLSTMDNGRNQAFSVCLVGAVVGAVHWSQRRRAYLAAAAAQPAPPDAAVPDAPPAAQPPPTDNVSWWRGPSGPVSFQKSGAATGGGGADGRYPGYMWGPDDSGPGPEDTRRPSTPRPPRRAEGEDRERSLFGLIVFVLALGAGAIGISATWHGRPLRFVLETGLTATLGVLGLGLVIGSFTGRRGRALIRWAVLACFLLGASATLPRSVGTDWQRATWRPASVAQVRPVYRLGSGQGTLDLAELSLRGGETTTRVEMGAGRLMVRVPRDATVTVEAKVGLGDIWLPEPGHHEVNVSPGLDRTGTFPPPAGVHSGGTIMLTLKLGAGQVEVLRDQAS